jgi:hypothetical protein
MILISGLAASEWIAPTGSVFYLFLKKFFIGLPSENDQLTFLLQVEVDFQAYDIGKLLTTANVCYIHLRYFNCLAKNRGLML